MKIENVQSIKNIPDKQQPQILRRGEFFVSEVLEIRGDTALLKSAQGTLLTARLLGDLWLTAGDHVETVVDEANGSRYVLRLVDVSRGDRQSAADGALEAPVNTAAQNARAQMLPGMLAMLKRNAGLEPKMAEFMARNGIPDTPENIETLTRLVKGELKADQVLLNMQGEAARAGTAIANRSATLGQAGFIESMAAKPIAAADTQAAAGVINPAAPDTSAAGFSPIPDNAAANTVAMQHTNVSKTAVAMPQTAGNVLQTVTDVPQNAAPTGQPNTAVVQTSAPDAKVFQHGKTLSLPTDMAAQQPPATVFDGAAAGIASQAVRQAVSTVNDYAAGTKQPVDVSPAVLADRLITLIVDLRSQKTLPAQLKKSVEELPAQIKELKISLQSSDINDRNTLVHHAENLDRQLSLMSELKRFDCYHIPLTGMNSEQTTAELYVFRQKRRKADADPETFAVLLALDTQHMGRVETMIRAAGHSVTLEFRLEMEALTGAFEQAAKELETVIAQTGFRLSGVSVRELAVRTTVLNAEEAQPKRQAPGTGSLDIRI